MANQTPEPKKSYHPRRFDESCDIRPDSLFHGHLYCDTHKRLFDPFASLCNTCIGPGAGVA